MAVINEIVWSLRASMSCRYCYVCAANSYEKHFVTDRNADYYNNDPEHKPDAYDCERTSRTK